MKKIIKDNALDAFIIQDQSYRYYLTSFDGSAGMVIVKKSGQVNLFVDNRYTIAATAQINDKVKLHDYTVENVKAFLAKNKIKKVGLSLIDATLEQDEELKKVYKLKTKGISLEGFRTVKTEWEISQIKKAAAIGDKVFAYILTELKVGITENELVGKMFAKIKELGGQGFSFDPIVATGPNSAIPHHSATNRKLKKNEFIKFDFGVKYNGYCSDMTRTIGFGEKFPATLVEIYFAVKEAQEKTLKKAKAGVTFKYLQDYALSILAEYGFDKLMGHGLGHGLGIDVHEFPYGAPQKEAKLKVGQVLTIEPGAYVEGLGGVRIEDDVVITATGCTRLTKTTKDFTIVEAK